ncbi:hypothetical protein JBO49_02755 [Serratia fonticola]|uniref:hypothetical protein n=1 Tax=Serratia fonticola TaxID=47917 RepID=UPI00192A7934|nr:hypothetical protein [Serratia fonticola]MBL5859532.1 hypothetical protein [Serratia fonticola]
MHNTIANTAEMQARAVEAFAIELNALADAAFADGRYSVYSAFVIAASEAPSFAAKLRALHTQGAVENSNNINEH